MELDDALRNQVAHYQHPSAAVTELLNNTPILLIVAVSGGGKDTVNSRLLKTGKYRHIVSYTTRAPRENEGVLETEGVDYHFVDFATAQKMLEEGKYVEADVYAANIYGTGVADIEQAHAEGTIATSAITIEGALRYLELAPHIKTVFLLPPNYEIWMDRLLSRYQGVPNARDIRLRMQEAKEEIELAMKTSDMYIVINDVLDETVELVDRIAHGEQVDPHYGKAVAVAEHLLGRLDEELAKPVD